MPQPGSRAVFLSYASQDAEAAGRICDALRAGDIDVWFDQSELVGGDAWDAKIRRQIRECALFIPVISRTTQARREGYFRLEWKLAAQRTHMMVDGTPFLLPVVIDITRDAEALVPEEFRDVQWTRLPDGAATAAFVNHVKRLCEDPDGELLRVAPADSDARKSGRRSAATAGPRPFLLGGRSYSGLAQLAGGLVQNWSEALHRWSDGSLLDWMSVVAEDEETIAALREIAAAPQLDADQKLAVALLVLNPGLPLIWRGEVITEAWMATHPEQAARLCESAVPAWLKKLREENWLEQCAARRAGVLAAIPKTAAPVNRALVEQLVFGPVSTVEEGVAVLGEKFSAARDPVVDALLKREDLSLAEAVLLLAVPRETFMTTVASAPPIPRVDPTNVASAENEAEAPCFMETHRLSGHTGAVHGVAFSAGVRWLVSGGNDAQIVAWDPRSGEEQRRMAGVSAPVQCVAFAPDGRTLISGGTDGVVQHWEVSIGRALRCFVGHVGMVNAVAANPRGRQLASGGADAAVILWNVWSGAELRRMHGHEDWIGCVGFSADGRFVASGSADNSVRLWNAETGAEVRRFDGHVGPVHSLAFSPDGKWLVTGGADATVRWWDVATGEAVRQSTGHSRTVYAATFHPLRPWLATGGADNCVRLWDARTGRELERLGTQTSQVRSLAFSGDGRWLTAGGSDHTVRVWNLLAADTARK